MNPEFGSRSGFVNVSGKRLFFCMMQFYELGVRRVENGLIRTYNGRVMKIGWKKGQKS